jgi:hypothetical protein
MEINDREAVISQLSPQEKLNQESHLMWKRSQAILEELYKKAMENGLDPIDKAREHEWTAEYLQNITKVP